MEAQRISLSQIHAAQLELLQEETDTCTPSLDLKLQDLRHQSGQGGRKISKYMIEAVSEECSEIIRIFGKEFLERVNTAGLPLISEEGPAASESTSIVQEARGEQSGESASTSVELQRLKAEAQVKQLQLEESHRQEMERLRGHYQQQAAETEERYATELFVLQQRLQETTGAQTYYR
ncbi:hypothetical protein XENOCAPTIV_003721 [Xenoophorus captivus]|uniref:Uncharacterized protein n=1 Tax=Xenoophorus captivus TaxID=1517983 RepID=A0ABV0QL84_9TELE